MPGLTVSTSPSSGGPPQQSISPHSRSASPVRPPYSPITPTLSAARLAPLQNGNVAGGAPPQAQAQAQALSQSQQLGGYGSQYPVMDNFNFNHNHNSTSSSQNPQSATQVRQMYTHSQEPQVSIAPPKPEPINLDENPDVLAMRSTISILQLQARKAERDMVTLQRIKDKAMENPEGFVRSLRMGEVKVEGEEREEEDEEDSSEDEKSERQEEGEPMDDVKQEVESEAHVNGEMNFDTSQTISHKQWEKLPARQNIVRCPPINWAKYGVVGESLNKMHADQVRRPSEGFPAKIKPDGSVAQVYGDGVKKEYVLAKPLGLNEVVGGKSKKKK